ncbi:glycosyltransferase family 2 protein [Mycolicibacterium sediminis]|uniref:Glycosyl transferase family 2 n=2 Tax=Mycolicibacterium sediminis TaxID=1286180 RepID=A0A7I7QNE1_9MYCO|nr:glycosyl transferase family 2 [Mycolicibacterium sediminis]
MSVGDLTHANATVDGRLAGTVSTSVVICAYTPSRWQAMCDAVDSVLTQRLPVDELLLVIDHDEDLFAAALERYRGSVMPKVLRSTGPRGLSGARNTGLRAAGSDVVAFLDDDARAEPGWSEAMVAHYTAEDVEGVGGYAMPDWPDARPSWLPAEFDWVVGCSYVGQPTTVAPVRNFIGANMSLRRDALVMVDGFDSSVGRIGSKPTGCEETELCIRISQRKPAARLLFDPDMRVWHTVSRDRTTFRYFVSRCYHEGRSKAMVSRLVGASDGLSSERAYVSRVLPRAAARGLASCTRAGLVRAAVVAVGVAVTSLGYLRGRVGSRSRGVVR